MPLITRVPKKGDCGTGSSALTSERTAGCAVAAPGRSTSPAATWAFGRTRRSRRVGSAALDCHHRVHQPEPFEGVACVPDLALEQAGQVLFDVGPGKCGAAEQYGPAA